VVRFLLKWHVDFRILITFYRYLSPLTLAVTVYNANALFHSASMASVVLLTSSKVFVSIVIGTCFWYLKKDQLYFFQNLGYTWRRLFVFAFLLDTGIWMAAIPLVYVARNLPYLL